MVVAEDVLRQARRWIGYREGRNQSTYFGSREGVPGQPWCGAFLQVCMEDAGMNVTYNGSSTSEPSPISTVHGASRYYALRRWIPRSTNYRAGDIVFFDWNGSTNIGRTDHVEIVEQNRGAYLITIGGNTSDAVMRKTRSLYHVVGFGRPLYSGVPSNPQPNNSLKDLERFLNARKLWAINLLPYVQGMPNLKPWDQSLHVVNLQRAINLVSLRGLTENGKYDGPTYEAIRDFQLFMGIKTYGASEAPKRGADPLGFAFEHTRFILSLAVKNIAEGRA